MQPADFDAVFSLWSTTDGIGIGPSDTAEQFARYLARNPGLSLVAHDRSTLVGAVMCGHDGRRGFIHHLAVVESHRRRGIGADLIEGCVAKLGEEGILKCHLFVLADNTGALEFWTSAGWQQRTDLEMFSRMTKGIQPG
jgi:ribosomal protein S18 acetylase RimI-like enzyme